MGFNLYALITRFNATERPKAVFEGCQEAIAVGDKKKALHLSCIKRCQAALISYKPHTYLLM